ncbi:MAG: S-layer homology domain-containing protein [Firmicutes bacterium]|nr:S-layer homology domain-containing protein [Bacillota bacterium]
MHKSKIRKQRFCLVMALLFMLMIVSPPGTALASASVSAATPPPTVSGGTNHQLSAVSFLFDAGQLQTGDSCTISLPPNFQFLKAGGGVMTTLDWSASSTVGGSVYYGQTNGNYLVFPAVSNAGLAIIGSPSYIDVTVTGNVYNFGPMDLYLNNILVDSGYGGDIPLTITPTNGSGFVNTTVIVGRVNAPVNGAGTSANPYLISSADQLAWLAGEVNAGISPYADGGVYYKLDSNIDLSGYSSGTGWVPIGYEDVSGNASHPFQGHFDGVNHTISGLSINDPNNGFNVGLFGYISGNSAVVQNLNVSVAGLAGDSSIGGIAGYLENGSITNCTVSGPISGGSDVGGVVGDVSGGSVTNCTVSGSINGTAYVGGIAGDVYNGGSVTNCNVSASVNGTDTFIGGVGGVAGAVEDNGSLSNCHSTGAVSGVIVVGGIAGEVYGSSVTGCYATGPVNSSGVLNANPDYGIDCYAGGVVGELTGGTMQSCYATGPVTGDGNYIGGVVGDVFGGSVLNCYATGTVTGTGYCVGGVAGLVADDVDANDNPISSGHLAKCYATGAVSGGDGVGGVVGLVRSGVGYTSTVQDCAALNPSVTWLGITGNTDPPSIGRVVGYNLDGALSSNIAYSGMASSGASFPAPASAANDVNGLSTTAAAINSDGTLGSRFTGPTWTTANGKLPGFGTPVNMPAYLQPSAPATVTGVTVSPNTNVSVVKGGSQRFTATVTGTNGPDQTVTWSVSGSTNSGTTINSSGVLTVAANETAATLTVTATSTVDPSKFGTATVAVPAILPAPGPVTVTGVTVSPNTNVSVVKGGTQRFTATVTGTNGPDQTVTWSVSGSTNSGTTISSGVLTVAANETAATLTVTATSTVDPSKFGTVTVTVTAGGNTGGGSSSGGGGGTAYYTVKFETNGGSKITNQSVANGSKLSPPADPTKDGYTFAGWYSNKDLTTPYDFSKKVTGSITLYAKWTESTQPKPTPQPTPTPTQPSAGWQNPFSDIKSTDWFYGDVGYVFGKGVFNGTTATTFSPGASVTRGMFVTVLWRQAGSPSGNGGGQFTDVEQGAYYAEAVKWAAANGIVKGISNTKFAPNGLVTREQMAAILYRYEQFSGQTPSGAGATKTFADQSKISDYAKTPVNALVKQGILSGKPNNLFDPRGTATRAEVAAVLHRFMEAMQ